MCSTVYTEQTGRSLKKRISKHKGRFVNNKVDSKYTKHLIEENFYFHENFEILHSQNTDLKLNHFRSFEMNKFLQQHFNRHSQVSNHFR